MADFLTAYTITGKTEGGYSNNPDDTGGETYAGISRNNWPGWGGWHIVDAFKANRDMHNLSKSPDLKVLVQHFYKQNFWDVLSLDSVNDQQVANGIYDFGVNAGTSKSAKFIQGAINANGGDLIVDGKIGNHTIDELNKKPAKNILRFFNDMRIAFYKSLAQRPGQHQFLASWLSRVKDYE